MAKEQETAIDDVYDEDEVVAEEVELPVVFLQNDDDLVDDFGAVPPLPLPLPTTGPSSNTNNNSGNSKNKHRHHHQQSGAGGAGAVSANTGAGASAGVADGTAVFVRALHAACQASFNSSNGTAGAAGGAGSVAGAGTGTGTGSFELHHLYENTFVKLTDKLYAKQAWPAPAVVARLLGIAAASEAGAAMSTAATAAPTPTSEDDASDADRLFIALYRDLYFRHLHARLTPTLADRVAAYDNYCDLFNILLYSDRPLPIDLPNQWIWDIIDEFIFQFQAFSQLKAAKKLTPPDAHAISARPDVWNVLNVLNFLYDFINVSKINQQLWASKNASNQGESYGPYGAKPLYRMLGYFSIVGQCRIHSLMGDYTLALKSLENIELNKKGLFARVTACHITTYYYVGFAYLMMRRYADAIKAFTHILLFISRTKQYHSRSYQYEVIQKKGEQMYALLTICLALCPQRIDENVHSLLREKYGDQLSRMQKGSTGTAGEEDKDVQALYEELFLFGCPKFISPFAATGSIAGNDATTQQLRVFMDEVTQHQNIGLIRSYLKLYTSLKIEKLASFLGKTPDELRRELLVYKHKTRQLRHTHADSGASVLEGEYSSPVDLDFYIRGDMIHVSESKVERRIGEWFVRQIGKFEDTIGNLNRFG
ncbi:Eukaryotic translation initiation factor 3 subunit L [Physocladia obscura]|uniref:Eukaryotic translation initiation factor 3 subunit L n=1 Tax=Physocladia obscura TaxID=109957 RepID=A0AAD5T900_9FUNG|nr:Eukaryotic translation initiation factor 3 subunit L [Physocladia obscura]